MTPADHAFYPAARQAVVDLGIVRRRRSTSPPTSPPAAWPTCRSSSRVRRPLDRRGRAAARAAARRSLPGGARAPQGRTGEEVDGIDHELVRRVAEREVAESSDDDTSGDNVSSMVRRIGQAKTEPRRRLRRSAGGSAGKVVFFAKHIDVMDGAEQFFAQRGIKLHLDPRRSDLEGAAGGHRRLRQRPGRPRHRLLADRGRRGHQPPGRLQRRPGRALVDQRGADPGDRPGPPDRAADAGHRVADHRGADHRRADRRADRRQGRPRRPGPSTVPTRTRPARSTSRSRRS